ncbi:MAG TPA: tRNA-dihydrouridine synthase [Pseudomonadales bacterium]|nr:tRNA-dihydrouridine synthase [Pseudomonadales bacterium]
MRILLAPMEGVVDHTMRDMLTTFGGIDRCVTEFVRVTNTLLPNKTYLRLCPELATGCKTPAGTPVYVQLLGSDPDAMAANAYRAADLGALGVDLNFGCPAKTVNNNDGGAALLKTPERIFKVVQAVRHAVPPSIPVTAKMRLGYTDKSLALDNALACCSGGAAELVVHARTKTDGYKPPAYWEDLAAIREAIDIPLIANGEVWTSEQFHRCRAVSGCSDVMIGRGMVANPGLANQIVHGAPPLTWADIIPLLIRFQHYTVKTYEPKYTANRIKQWLNYLSSNYTESVSLFEKIRKMRDGQEVLVALQNERAIASNKSNT